MEHIEEYLGWELARGWNATDLLQQPVLFGKRPSGATWRRLPDTRLRRLAEWLGRGSPRAPAPVTPAGGRRVS